MNDPIRDPAPDPALRVRLAEARPMPGLPEEELERLARRISVRARLPLARLRNAGSPWWVSAAGWSDTVLPLAAAAGIALVFALSAAKADHSLETDAHRPGPAPGVEAFLGFALPPAEYEFLAGDEGDPDLLLAAALAQH
jgi:hypothetical protein